MAWYIIFLKWLLPMFYMGSRLEASHMASCMSSTSGDMVMQQHVWTILVSYDRSRASLGMAAYRDQVGAQTQTTYLCSGTMANQ